MTTQPTTDIAEDIDLDLGAMSREILEGTAHQCANDGYSFDEIRTDVEKLNLAFMPPLPQSDIEQLLEKYNPAIVNKNRVLDAIQNQDVHLLDQCLRYIAIVKRRDFTEFNILYFDIKKAFKGKLDLQLFKNKLNAEVRKQEEEEQGKKPDVATLAQDWAGRHRDMFAWDEARQCLRMWNGDYWEEQPEKSPQMDQYAVAAMQDAGLQVNTQGSLNLFIRLATGQLVREFKPVEGKINFTNGTLDLATMKLRNHDRDDNFTYSLTYFYSPDSTYERITAFLVATIPDEYARIAFMAHIGLALMRDIKMHFTLMIVGPTRAGKSTLLNLANVTCGVLAGDYAGDTLFSPELEGKRTRFKWNKKPVCCVDELPTTALKHEGIVKDMTAHSGVEQRGMHRDEEEGNRWLPKMLLAMNEKPHYKDMSGAIKERLIPVPVPKQLEREERDIDLFDSMLPEIGAFAAACIRYAKAMLQRGYYPLSGGMKQVMYELETMANPLKAFLLEECILDPGAHIFTDKLYELYKAYCAAGNNTALGRAKMSNALTEMGKGITHKSARNPDHGGNVERGLLGVRLRTHEDPSPDPDKVDAQFEDDSPIVVDDVDDTKKHRQQHRQHGKTACEAGSLPVVDDVDDRIANIVPIEPYISLNGAEIYTPVYGENKNGKMSSTSSTNGVKPHVERHEHVDDRGKASSTGRQHRQQIDPDTYLPKWLIIGTEDWNKQVKMRGQAEMQEARRIAIEQHEQGQR